MTRSGTFDIQALDGIQTFTVGGQVVDLAALGAGTPLVITGDAGTLTLTGYAGNNQGGTISYTFVHDSSITHDAGDGANSEFRTFTVSLTDVDGDSRSETLYARIVHDVPALLGSNSGQGGGEGSHDYVGIPGPGEGGNTLVNGLGGERGFGEQLAMAPNDDGSSGLIDISSVFAEGMNLFGTTYDSFYINNNGNITFEGPLGPTPRSASPAPTANR